MYVYIHTCKCQAIISRGATKKDAIRSPRMLPCRFSRDVNAHVIVETTREQTIVLADSFRTQKSTPFHRFPLASLYIRVSILSPFLL